MTEKKKFKHGFDKVRGIWWTSSEAPDALSEVQVAAIKAIIGAEKVYVDAVYFNYMPKKPESLTGTCIAYNKDLKEITVDMDILKTDSNVNTNQPVEIQAKWGRPNLTESEVVNKRVKIWIQKEINKETRLVEIKERSLSAIAPPGAGLGW